MVTSMRAFQLVDFILVSSTVFAITGCDTFTKNKPMIVTSIDSPTDRISGEDEQYRQLGQWKRTRKTNEITNWRSTGAQGHAIDGITIQPKNSMWSEYATVTEFLVRNESDFTIQLIPFECRLQPLIQRRRNNIRLGKPIHPIAPFAAYAYVRQSIPRLAMTSDRKGDVGGRRTLHWDFVWDRLERYNQEAVTRFDPGELLSVPPDSDLFVSLFWPASFIRASSTELAISVVADDPILPLQILHMETEY